MSKIETDLNAYFEYVDNVIKVSTVHESEKTYYRKLISIYKVTGMINFDPVDLTEDLSRKNTDEELYILYEMLSFRFYKLLNYWAWRKRTKFGII
jgi:hypothetical protein